MTGLAHFRRSRVTHVCVFRARLAAGRRSAVPDLEERASMIDTLRLTAKQANDLLTSGEASSDEIFAAYRAAIDERDGELNCFLHVSRRRARRGDPDRAQGRDQHEGHPDHGRLEDPRELRARLRLDRRGAVQGARAAHDRQDEHGRVRDGLVDRELGVRPDAEPVGSRAGPRRLVGRVGRSRGGRSRSVGARLGHRRLDQAAGRPVRRRRAPADLRHGLPLRHRRLRVEPRPGRADHEDRRRLRVPVLGHRRPRLQSTRRPSSCPSRSRSRKPRT